MEIENEDMNSLEFQSIYEILNFDSKNLLCKQNASLYNEYSTRYLGDRSVPTVLTAPECIRAALDGDSKLWNKYIEPELHNFQISIEDQMQKIKKNKRVRLKSNFGNELDIHKVYQGKIDKAWDSTIREKIDDRIDFVTLVLDNCEPYRIEGIYSIWNSILISQLCNIIELSGRNVQIMLSSATFCTYYKKKYTNCSIIIKRYNEALSLERLGAMAHLGFFRSFVFMAYCMSQYQANPDLGRKLDLTIDRAPLSLQEEIKAGHTKAVFVPSCLSKNRAVFEFEKILNNLKKDYLFD